MTLHLTDVTSYTAQRPSSDFMDGELGQTRDILDHGFVRVVDYMGNDDAVVQAARVSYGSGTKSVSDDRGLIRYLMRRWHTTPFEMCEIKLHVKLPVFVARQWIRHRTANVNEYSARYSILDKEFYFPEREQLMYQSLDNKQGRSGQLADQDADAVLDMLRDDAENAYTSYEAMIEDQGEGGIGLARELARINLPTNIYTQWYWKVDVHNLMHFLRLRADPHAQYEIRVYADAICEILKGWMPHTYEAFVDYQLEAKSFSRMEMEALQKLLNNCCEEMSLTPIRDMLPAMTGMSKREQTEFLQKLDLDA
jgi:thymidylate synthase (FAD)